MDKQNQDNLTLKDQQILESAEYKALHNTKKSAIIKQLKNKLT